VYPFVLGLWGDGANGRLPYHCLYTRLNSPTMEVLLMQRFALFLLLVAALIAPTVFADGAPADGPVVPGTPDNLEGITAVTAATFEEQVLELVNQERWNNGQLPPLKGNTLLDAAAETHSDNMAVRNFFAHCDLDTKTSPWDRMEAAGYTGWNYAAENIAAGYGTPAEVMNGWMNSSGHRANILSTSVREIGIGYVYQSNDTNNIRYDAGSCTPDAGGHGPFFRFWTQDFGRISSVMPVVINREAYEATTRQVNLYMYGEGWATQMRFRNENGNWSAWQPYQANSSWQLSDGSGIKTVFAEIKDGSGNVRSADDSIALSLPGPALAVSASELSFALQSTGAVSQTRQLTIQNTGGELLTWNLSEEPAASWLSANVTNGTVPSGGSTTLTLTATRSGLLPDVYETTLRIDGGSAANSPQLVTVTFLLTEQQPVFLPMVVR
ncbi:MAG: CAP domain-containing protein, partial [Anaerolineales bacterium]|nr:CAP domain-containing protein [Anaerolineales bacterium]